MSTQPIVPAVMVNVAHNNGKPRKWHTDVLIRVGPNLIANASLGGKWCQKTAFHEFKRGHKGFKVREGMEKVAELLKTMELK